MSLKMEPVFVVLLFGFAAAGVSCLVLYYLNSIVLTSADLLVQVFGWVMFASLLIMGIVPLFRFELKGAKRILKPLESDR